MSALRTRPGHWVIGGWGRDCGGTMWARERIQSGALWWRRQALRNYGQSAFRQLRRLLIELFFVHIAGLDIQSDTILTLQYLL